MQTPDTLIYFGDAVKALGNGKIGGYLVRFSTESDPDLTGDFFTKNTDFDLDRSTKATVLYDHGLDDTLKRRKLGMVECKIDDAGVWAEGQLELRDEYEKRIYEMAQAGKLGWSSGTAPHLVERKQVGNAFEVMAWPLGLDASLTPRPAEPRTLAVSLKSYMAEREAPATKGLFESELASHSLQTWHLRSTLDRVFERIALALRNADVTGVRPDVAALVAEAVAAFDARFVPAVVQQINDFAESNDEHFWLKNFSGALATGTPLLDHSAAVVSAVAEHAHQTDALKAALAGLLQRIENRIEFRQSDPTKSGAMLSKVNREKLANLCASMRAGSAASLEMADQLDSLLAAAEPKSAQCDDDEMKKSLADVGSLYAEFLQTESRLCAAGV